MGMKLALRTLGVLVFTAIAACAGFARPPEGKGTEYPCGVWGVSCHNGACCDWGDICGEPGYGSFQRCPDGSCCTDGDPFYGSSQADAGPSSAGAARQRPDGVMIQPHAPVPQRARGNTNDDGEAKR